MSITVASSPLRLSNSEALSKSQEASQFIKRNAPATSLISFPFLTKNDSAELWTNYENLLYSCLRTGDDRAAHYCLERLASRFGTDDERVMGLRGLYQEAMAEDSPALLEILHQYDEILVQDPSNTPVRKRRVALLRSIAREGDAINALVELLGASPTDIEAWAELADLYTSQGLYQQAEFCLEEILLSTPNAWNVHARLGEILYVSAATSQDRIGSLTESSSDKLMATYTDGSQSAAKAVANDNNDELPVLSIKDLQNLTERATSTLAETARLSGYGDRSKLPNLSFVTDLLKSSTMAQQR
ncbi:MAG: hypothetical protein Q9170_005977 [Blastenia crenularia]